MSFILVEVALTTQDHIFLLEVTVPSVPDVVLYLLAEKPVRFESKLSRVWVNKFVVVGEVMVGGNNGFSILDDQMVEIYAVSQMIPEYVIWPKLKFKTCLYILSNIF